MSDAPITYSIDLPDGRQVSNTIQRYRGILLSTWVGNGASLRAFVDALSPDERLALVALQQDDVLPDGANAVLALWRREPPERFWVDGRPPCLNGLFPTMHPGAAQERAIW